MFLITVCVKVCSCKCHTLAESPVAMFEITVTRICMYGGVPVITPNPLIE